MNYDPVSMHEEVVRWQRRGVIIDRVCMLLIAFGGTILVACLL